MHKIVVVLRLMTSTGTFFHRTLRTQQEDGHLLRVWPLEF